MKRYFNWLMATILITVSNSIMAQSYVRHDENKLITLSHSNVQLRVIVLDLEKNYGYGFYGSDSILNMKASIHVANVRLQQVLKMLSYKLPVNFSIEANIIIMERKSNSEFLQKFDFFSKIMGVVVDERHENLPNVSVFNKRSGKGAVTNESGQFMIPDIYTNDTLIFSFVGKETKKYVVVKQEFIHITLASVINEMNAVVVNTGYQEIPIERATGSFKQTSYSATSQIPRLNILEGFGTNLIGYLPALKSAPGLENTTGSIRGKNTIRGSINPLILVDDCPFYGDLSMLNGDDIESITVANDASSTAIYGTRASNGVILIVTKKARWKQKPQISFTSFAGITSKPDVNYLPTVQPVDYIDLEQQLFANGLYTGRENTNEPLSPVVEALIAYRNGAISVGKKDSIINYYKGQNRRWHLSNYFYQPGFTTQQTVSISGSTDSMAYYGSLSRGQTNFNEKGLQHTRITGLGNLQIRHNKLSILTRLFFSGNNIYNNNVSIPSEIPYLPVIDDKGKYLDIPYAYRKAYIDTLYKGQLLDWLYRPLQEQDNANNVSTNWYYTFNTKISYKLTTWVQLQALYQYGQLSFKERKEYNLETFYARNLINQFSYVTPSGIKYVIPQGSILHERSTNINLHNGRLQFNINHHWNNHELTVIAGSEIQSSVMRMSPQITYGYNSPYTGVTIDPDSSYAQLISPGTRQQVPTGGKTSDSIDRYISYLGNIIYTWKEKITTSFSLRHDQSNRYEAEVNNTFNPLWAAGFLLHMYKFSFYPDRFPEISLRGTIGVTGNKDNQASRRSTISIVNNTINGIPVAYIDNPARTGLQFEKMRTINIGLDISTPDKRIQLNVDAYWKKGTNLLGFSEPNITSGVSLMKSNTSSLSNQGIDVNMQTIIITKPVKWELAGWMSYTCNKVLSDELQLKEAWQYADMNYYIPQKGHPVDAIYAFSAAKLDSLGNPVGYLNGHESKDYANIITSAEPDNIKYIGPASPKVYGCMTNAFHYKRFIFSFQVSGKFHYFFRRSSLNATDLLTGSHVHGDFYKSWQKPGDELLTTVPSLLFSFNTARENFYKFSETLVEKGDHIRWQNVQLLYYLENKKLFGWKYSKLEAGITLIDGGIIWRANDERLDPDVMQDMLPTSKSILLSLKATF